jgi:nitrite reductase/ring-hydroxylating ferredoxin subunit
VADVEFAPATGRFDAYDRRDIPQEDAEFTHVGPGTPCGEYFRRFWHPVSLSSNLRDLPVRVRVLGEDLVLFRDGHRRVGLLPLHCSHRGTSLEFGTVERRGIRCCYHGWLYDISGRVLETPGEPADSTLADRIHHGAYPTIEYRGLVFAYLGPPAERPAFPILDTFEMPGYRLRPNGSRHITSCNWLQLKENAMDPVHAVFLHGLEEARDRLNEHRPSVHPEKSLDDYFAAQEAYDADVASLRDHYRERVVEWRESPVGMVSIHTQRTDDFVYVRVGDFIPPNIHQFPPTWYRVVEEENFRPPTGIQWVVPVDDTHSSSFGFSFINESGPSAHDREDRLTPLRSADSIVRSYEDRQRAPGDYEAQESQRPIAVHRLEHLATTDAGVIMVRNLIRQGIRTVQRGAPLARSGSAQGTPIPTYGQITVLRAQRGATPEEERAILREAGRKVASGLRLDAMRARVS